MPQFKIAVCRFPYGAIDNPDTTDWLIETAIKSKADKRISEVFSWRFDDTPITMTRNKALRQAREAGADFVLMIDNDMKPDAYLPTNMNRLGSDPLAKPFWGTALDFLIQHNGPAVIASPYCGPPPHENVYIFQWANNQSDHPNTDLRLAQFTREEAAKRAGIEEVGALPTGLLMMHVSALDRISPPYTYYEWADETESEKGSTEDVTFTRDLSLAGVPIYVNWDTWSGHWKRKCVGKPAVLSADGVAQKLKDAWKRDDQSNVRLVMVGEGRPDGGSAVRSKGTGKSDCRRRGGASARGIVARD